MNAGLWKNPYIKRASNLKWATLKNNKIKEYESLNELIFTLKRWNPSVPILVSRAGDTCFLPPAEHTDIANKILEKYRINLLVSLSVFSLFTAVLIVSALVTRAEIFFHGSALFLLFLASIFLDYYLARKRLDSVNERSLFFYWVFNSDSVRKGFFLWMIIIFVIGAIQLGMMRIMGGLDAVYVAVGAVNKNILNGEVWRLISGPFLHNSIAHFINNFIFILIVGPICWGIYRVKSLLIFVMGASAGAVASAIQFLVIENYPYDVYGGISSGIFSLFGFLVVDSFIKENVLPKFFNAQVLFLSISSILAAEIFSKNPATLSHISGFVLGSLIAFFAKNKC